MKKNQNHNEKKSRRKWPWIVLLCIVGVIGLARLALMSGPVQRWVKNTIVDTANKQLRPQLTIGELSGDLWNSATLTNIVLTEDSTVASVDTLHLEYSPLSYFGDAFKIHELRVTNPFLKLKQEKDSTINATNWVTSTDTSGGTFAVSISSLLIEDGRFDISLPGMLPDSSFTIDNMNLAGDIGYYGDEYSAGIDNFSLDIKRTRLDSVVSIAAAADADESSVTLEKLAIATGHSMLNASGRAAFADSVANFEAAAKPLGWQDLAAYMDSLPVRNDINLSLDMNGSAEAFDIDITVNAEGIDQLALQSSFQRDSALALTSFGVTASRLDLQSFMGDTAMPRLQDFELQAQGRVPIDKYQQSQMEGTLSAANIRQSGYQLDKLQSTFTLNNSNAEITIEPIQGGQRVRARADLSRIWSEQPQLVLSVQGNNINPDRWVPGQGYSGSLTFNGSVQGAGWFPEQEFWDYRLRVNESRLMGQPLDEATFTGRFNGTQVTNDSQLKIAQSTLSLQAEINELQSVPEFSYTLRTGDLNLADLGLQEYPSFINATVTGNGQGTSLETLRMQASAEMDSSIFKGETINNMTLELNVADSVVSIEESQLSSGIADGSFTGRFHLQDVYDSENRMDMDLQLKDLSSFASLAGVDILQATGSIDGRLKPVTKDSLVFNGRVHLTNVNYDNQFISQKIDGDVRVEFEEEPKFVVDLDVSQPTIAGTGLQNAAIKTEGQLADAATQGSFQMDLRGAKEGRIVQQGRYRIGEDTTSVRLTAFDLTTPLRTLSLQQPFHVDYTNGAIQTDTLHLRADDGSAFVKLIVPYADTLQQKAYLHAEKLNLAAIQNAVLDEAYFEGTLFSELNVNRTDTSLTASGDVLLSKIKYGETELDTLQFTADVKNKRLKGRMELHQRGELIAEGNADIPFKATNPGALDEGFFEKPVSGELKLHALKLERFESLLERMGYANTKGIVQFNAKLDGQAGQPQFDATLSLKEASLSGVPVDSLVAAANYRHSDSKLDLNATLTSLQQKALEVDAEMPLAVDLQDLDVALPGPQDSISVDIATNRFNLKALNDFVPRNMARNLEGRINGDIEIRGPRSDLQAGGELTLQKGAVRLVTAGIRLDHIESTIQLESDKIVLANLYMESGSGSLNANGEIGMEQLVPGDMDISIDAKNFKAANTEHYNAIINLDLQAGGSVTQPNISGTLKVLNGFIELDNFGEKSVEQVSLDTTLAPETQTSVYDSLSLDMDIELNRRFFVRNQRYLEMEIELEGEIDLLKDAGEDLQMFGTLTTANGYAKPLGKRFELEEGTLAFSGPPANPQVNIRTLYEPPQADQEIKIWYTIEGTVEDPQFKYESQPQMDLAGIISYTLFGQPFYKLNPAEQSVASSSSNNSAADFAVEVLLDRVESLATRRLGIDVVRIEQTRVGGESGTAVTTGWYINPQVFFAIQNVITGSTPTTGFFLEYYLQENLKLILSQGNENRQGVDLQWEYDY